MKNFRTKMMLTAVLLLCAWAMTAQSEKGRFSMGKAPVSRIDNQQMMSNAGERALLQRAGREVNSTPLAPLFDNADLRDGYLTWAGAFNYDGIGTMGPVEFSVAQRWEPSDLSDYAGQYITKIKFAPYATTGHTFTLKIWQGGDVSGPATVVYERLLNTNDLTVNVWNEFDVIPAVPIDATQELWIGYDLVAAGERPAGVDAGPAVPWKGNMMYYNGAWTLLSEMGSGLDFNWAIQAYVSTENPTYAYPAACTGFIVLPDINQELFADLSWTNPSTTAAGNPLNSLNSIEILRNGELIHSIANPTPGAAMSWRDNAVPAAGLYTYTIYATNDDGNGITTTTECTIGNIYLMRPGETVEITTCSGTVYDNGGPTGNYQAFSNDIMIIHPATEGGIIGISGTYEIESTYDNLHVYDGEGTNGTLLHTYSNSFGGTISDVSSSGALTLQFTADDIVHYSGFEIFVRCVTPTSISGQVTDLATGSPIANATLHFNGIENSTVTTDETGNYTASLLSGPYKITVSAAGYNTLVEQNFEILAEGITGKNFAMTAPAIAVTPTSVTMTAPYTGEARTPITISNTGNGPLTWHFERAALPDMPTPSWLRCEPSNGTIAAGETMDVELIGDGWYTPENYAGTALFRSESPAVGDVEVTVNFTVIESGCPAPTNLAASWGETFQDVVLHWQAPDATNDYTYNIYTDQNSQTALVEGVTATTYTFEQLPVGDYSFVVRTVCADGGISSTTSNTALIETQHCDPNSLCTLHFRMWDTFGDGWNNAYIDVIVDGESYGEISMKEYAYVEDSIRVCPGFTELVWHAGSFDAECSFELLTAYGVVLYATSGMPTPGTLFSFENLCDIPEFVVISGTVSRLSDGSPIEGATVFYDGPQGEPILTNSNGGYSVTLLQGHNYHVSVSKTGFNTIEESNFEAPIAPTTKNFQMTAPQMVVTPLSSHQTTNYGFNVIDQITITNSGDGPLSWEAKFVETTPENSVRAENSPAMVALDTYIYHFTLNNPAGATPYGTANDAFMNSGEYYQGMYYYANTSGQFGMINPEDGIITEIISGGAPYACIAYNPADGQMYGLALGGVPILYIVDPATGAAIEHITCPFNNYIFGMTIDNDGRFFLIDGTASGISEMDPETGAIINSWHANFAVNYGQDIACDREENEIYWASFNANTFVANLYRFDPEEGTFESVGTFADQASCFAIKTDAAGRWLTIATKKGVLEAGESITVDYRYDGFYSETGGTWTGYVEYTSLPETTPQTVDISFTINPPDCDAPRNLTATIEDYNNVVLNWLAPQDAAGLTEYRIYYQGSQFLLGSVPAGTTTFTDAHLSAGTYSYEVRAYYESGNPCLSLTSNVATATAVEPWGSITGSVTDIASADGIAGATVTIGPATATTNGSGAYSIANVTAGTYTATILAEGYEPLTQELTVQTGSNTFHFALALAPCQNIPSNVTAETDAHSVTLSWSMNATTATITLEAHNVWGDGTGYQMLLDGTHSTYGNTIPTAGSLTDNCSISPNLYNVFDHKIPENADPSCTSGNTIVDGSGTINIAAGIYDFCMVNPVPNSRLWIAASNYGRHDDFEVLSGYNYHFRIDKNGGYDSVILTTTPTKREEYTFNVYRSGQKIASGITAHQYTDENLPNGTHCYTITAICTNGEESAPSDEACVSIGEGISEMANNIKIYPNPANTQLVIEGENLQHIAIFNALGQKIFDIQTTDNQLIIDTRSFENGIYLLRMTDNNGNTIVQRVVVMH